MNNIRNFCIIAHIDHGKTSLADSLLKITQTINSNSTRDFFLDNMDIERERGITIKSHPIKMNYIYQKREYILNLIDTPGHVDFSYEVSRSISACEGAILVIDSTQGIQSQTISNFYLARDNKLKIIPVLNKIDLENSNIKNIYNDIIKLLKCKYEDIIQVSAKKMIGISNLLKEIILKIPSPTGDCKKSLSAIVFDSIYNHFRGIEVYLKIENGKISQGQKLKFLSNGKVCIAEEIGIFKVKKKKKNIIFAGDVGYAILGIKDNFTIKIGDTLTSFDNPTLNKSKIIKKFKSVVFAGIYPINTSSYEELKIALKKLKLNDSSLIFSSESSLSLGLGFRCGFLGMLHMEIVKERLEREYKILTIITVPNVCYNIFLKKNKSECIKINNPSEFSIQKILLDRIEEPYVFANIITLQKYIGNIITLCIEKRGILKNQIYLNTNNVELHFELPLSEIIFDFYDKLKTISKGYSTLDYNEIGHRVSDIVKLDILINHKLIDALSILTHIKNAFYISKKLCKKLKEIIPRQQFEIPIQASIGNKIISRETIKSLRKDVTAKCYGGDISRKRKLLEKQKKGKKKMRMIGNIEIPQSAFIAILKTN